MNVLDSLYGADKETRGMRHNYRLNGEGLGLLEEAIRHLHAIYRSNEALAERVLSPTTVRRIRKGVPGEKSKIVQLVEHVRLLLKDPEKAPHPYEPKIVLDVAPRGHLEEVKRSAGHPMEPPAAEGDATPGAASEDTQPGNMLAAEQQVQTRVIELLSVCRDEGVTALYRRGDHRRGDPLYRRITEVVSEAKEFVYTLARTHREMLITDGGQDGWLIRPLITKMKEMPGLPIRVLLADGFDPGSGYRVELDSYFGLGTRKSHCHAARDTTRGTILRFEEMSADCDFEHNYRIRLLHQTPLYCMLATEKCVLWEPYLPSQTGGCSFVLEARSLAGSGDSVERVQNIRPSMHTSLVTDFVTQYNRARRPSEVLEEYIDRKYPSGSRVPEEDRQWYELNVRARDISSKWTDEDLRFP